MFSSWLRSLLILHLLVHAKNAFFAVSSLRSVVKTVIRFVIAVLIVNASIGTNIIVSKCFPRLVLWCRHVVIVITYFFFFNCLFFFFLFFFFKFISFRQCASQGVVLRDADGEAFEPLDAVACTNGFGACLFCLRLENDVKVDSYFCDNCRRPTICNRHDYNFCPKCYGVNINVDLFDEVGKFCRDADNKIVFPTHDKHGALINEVQA